MALVGRDVQGAVLAHHHAGELGDAREEVRGGLKLLGCVRDEDVEDLPLSHGIRHGPLDFTPVALPLRLAEAVAGVLPQGAAGELVVGGLAARGARLVGPVGSLNLLHRLRLVERRVAVRSGFGDELLGHLLEHIDAAELAGKLPGGVVALASSGGGG